MSIEEPVTNCEQVNWTEFKKKVEVKSTGGFKDYLGGLFSSKTFEETQKKNVVNAISLVSI